MEFAKEWQASNRINEKTVYDREKANYLLSRWTDEYNNRLKIITEALPNWLANINDDCIVCKGYSYNYSI